MKIINGKIRSEYGEQRNFFDEGCKYITCHVSPQGYLSPMGNAKDKDYAVEIAKKHKHVLCRLVILRDFRERSADVGKREDI